MKLIALKIYENELSATVFQHVLKNHGIQSRIFKNFSIRGGLISNTYSEKGYELQVLSQDYNKAKVILDDSIKMNT